MSGRQPGGYERYAGGSVKGDACIDWGDKKARAALLGRIVGDADWLLKLSQRTQGLLDKERFPRNKGLSGWFCGVRAVRREGLVLFRSGFVLWPMR